jgi:iron complex outermembrane receptor protein
MSGLWLNGGSYLRATTSVVALAGAAFLPEAAIAQAAVPAETELRQDLETANPGESLAADAEAFEQPSPETAPLDDPEMLQGSEDAGQILVTGTAIRGVAPVGSATVNIGRDTIIQSGVRDATSLIAQLPQGAQTGLLENNAGRSSSLNLRGLGTNATLVLFDGHRTVAQNRNQLTDPNLVPFSAVDRVEVVTDGASAIYGSDAVAGVVNYILRRPFDGAEVTARYTNTLYDEVSIDAVGGATWGGGGVVVAFGAEANTPVTQYEIPQLRSDLTPFGGRNNLFLGTAVRPGPEGALIAGTGRNATVYGLPDGLNGRIPTAAEVLPLRNQPELFDTTQLQDFYSKRRRLSALVRVEQDLEGLGEIKLTALYSRRTNTARGQGDGAFQTINVAIPTDSPYYIQGLGTGPQSIIYNFRLNNPDRPLNREDHLDTANLIADYRVPLVADFQLTASAGYGRSSGCEVCQPQANTILTSQIASLENGGLFNPYLQGPQPSYEKIFGVFIQNSAHEMYNAVAKIDGGIFALPAGDVRIAVGGEYLDTSYKHNSLYTLNPTTELVDFRVADSGRTVYSVFGEVFIPVFGSGFDVPLFRRLDLNLAIRHDDYSDFGTTTNPKFGISWKPIEDLLLRGSYGTSFRAPTLSETDFNVVGAASRAFYPNNLNNPNVPVTRPGTSDSLVLASSFRFAPLRPETAKIFSAGADYTPGFVPDLRLGVTYYSVDYKDQISSLPAANTAFSSPEQFALYSPFFIPAPQPATCVDGAYNGNPGTPEYATYNPLYLPYLNAAGSFPPPPGGANDCQLIGIVDTGTRNLGRVKQSGLDFTLNYLTDVSFGTVSLDAAFTKILELERNVLPGTPLVSKLDEIGEQVSARGRVSVGLTSGPFSGNIAARYVGSYLNNQTPTVNGVRVPEYEVPSWTTFDLNVSFTPEATDGFISGTRFTVSARNLTDKDPPLVITNNAAFDENQHSVLGRIITLEVSKSF